MIKKKNLNILSLEKRLMLDAAAVAAISNPIFHFDASDIDADGDTLDQPANGTAISTFHDDKGVDNVASAGGSARPTYQENIFDTGLGGIVFDGINDEFTMGTTTEINNASFPEKSFAMVFKTGADTSGNQIIYEQGGGTNGMSISLFNGDIYAFSYIGSGNRFVVNLGTAQANTAYSLIAIYDSVLTNTWSARLNGVAGTPVAVGGAMAGHGGAPGIGGDNGTSRSPVDHSGVSNAFFEGALGEFWSWNHALTAGEITSVENYFNAKWFNSAPTQDVNQDVFTTDGATMTITNADLQASDLEQAANEIIYEVTALPTSGLLKLSGVTLNINDTFTQDDIDNNRITYEHDNSGLGTDSFTFTLSDGIDTNAADTFTINIIDPGNPNVTTNTGMAVADSSTTTITTAMLNVTDGDTAATNVDFNVTAGLAHGQLELTTNPGVAITTFTLDDLQNNRVVYVHTGAQIDDSFTFNTFDGTTTMPGHVFSIDVNEDPSILDNSVIVASENFEGGATGWNINTTTNNAFFSEFLGRFVNLNGAGSTDQDIFKTYTLSNTQDKVQISFDFYELDRWEDESFLIFVDDVNVISHSFNSGDNSPPGGVNGNVSWKVEKISEQNTNISFRNDADQAYRYTLSIDTTNPNVKLGFGVNFNNTGNPDFEAYGIDNLEVREIGGNGAPTLAVAENAANGASVGFVHTTDGDTGQNLSYSITPGGTGDGIFTIDATTGEITVLDNTTIDFETTTSYTLIVRATDGGPGAQFDEQTITINITDIQERPDWGSFGPYSISEGAANGTSIATINATDQELDTLTYSIVGGNNDSIFAIDTNSGEITVSDNTNLDFENDNSYTLTIRAREDGFNQFTDTTVTINITDTDEPPSLDSIQAILNLNPNVEYNATTGNFYLFVSANVNFATAQGLAAANTLNGVAGHLVTITSSAENNFVDNMITDHVWMGASDSAVEGEWRWVEGPEAGQQFSDIFGNPVGGFFEDWASGEPNGSGDGAILRTNNEWRDENTASGQSYVIEWEGADVIDNGPYQVDHALPDGSDITNGTSVGTVFGSDPEADTVNYSITGGDPSSLFAINPTSGEITINDVTQLDATVQDVYNLTVRVTEDNGSNQFDEVTVTITFNELPNTLTNTGVTLNEGDSVTITAAELSIIDNDDAPPAIIFNVTSNPGNGHLELTTAPNVPIISFTLDDIQNNLVVYVHDGSETLADSFDFTISDTSGTLPANTFNITVTAINDAPIIQNLGFVEGLGNTVSSSAIDAISDAVLHFDALDLDGDGDPNDQPGLVPIDDPEAALGAPITTGSGTQAFNSTASQFPQGNDSFFAMDVTIPASPNGTLFETGGSGTGVYMGFDLAGNFVLRAGDGATPPGGIDTNLTQAAILRTPETPLVGRSGTIFAELSVTNGSVTAWFLENGVGGGGTPILLGTANAPAGFLESNFIHGAGSGGLGGTNSGVGGENNAAYNGTISGFRFYTNASSPIGAGGLPPLPGGIFVDKAGTGSEQNNASGLAVYNEDGFATGLGGVDFSSVTGSLSIAQSTLYNDSVSGDRSFAMSFKTGSSVAGTEVIFDHGGATNGYNFTISGGNLYAYAILAAGATPSVIDLGAVEADTIYTLTAVHDVGPNTWTASLDGVSTAGANIAEIIHGDEGGIGNTTNDTRDPLNPTAALSNAPFTGLIGEIRSWNHALSAGEQTTVETYFMAKWGQGSTNNLQLDVAENVSVGHSVIDSEVVNPEDFKGETITWSIQSGNTDGIFGIDATTGEITVINTTSLDFDTGLNSYNLVIRAADSGVDGPALFQEKTITINLTDINEAPTIDTNTGATMAEGATLTITQAMLDSSDQDGPDAANTERTYTAGALTNGHIEVSSVVQNTFTQADIDNGNVVFIHDGSETLAASFTLSLADGGEDGTTPDTDTFNITVTPVNDLPILGASAMNVGIGNVKTILPTELGITDVDNTNADLVINVGVNPAQGQLELTSNPGVAITSFNYTDVIAGNVVYVHGGGLGNDSFDFTITDGIDTTAVNTFTINVAANLDPVLTPATFTIAENAVNTAAVGTVIATDFEDPLALLNFSIIGGNTGNVFGIDNSGNITIADNTNLDRETVSAYSLLVEVQDSLGGRDAQTITVNISNINEAPTGVLLSNSSFDEESAIGTVVATLSSVDVDGPSHSYSLIGDPKIFSIVGNTVVLTADTDFEEAAETDFTITIRTDDGGFTFDQLLTITMNDVIEPSGFVNTDDNTARDDSGSDRLDRTDELGDGNAAIIARALNNGGSSLEGSLFVGSDFEQILRENTTFEIRDLINNVISNEQGNQNTNIIQATSQEIEEEFFGPGFRDSPQDTALEERFTNLREALEFLSEMDEANGAEDNASQEEDTTDNQNTELLNSKLEQEFQDVLTYHVERKNDLRKALLSE